MGREISPESEKYVPITVEDLHVDFERKDAIEDPSGKLTVSADVFRSSLKDFLKEDGLSKLLSSDKDTSGFSPLKNIIVNEYKDSK